MTAPALVSPAQRLAGLDLPELAWDEVRPLLHSAFWAERDQHGQPTWTAQGRDYRRWACHNSLLRFALTYFTPSLTQQDTGVISLCEAHLTLIRIFQRWRVEGEHYDAFVGDRGLGKSTIQRIAIAWVLAYGYRRSVMLFSRTDPQAKKHFLRAANVFLGRRPSISVPLLADFPELQPVAGAGPGRLRLAGGGILSAASIASSTEGENADDLRPDVLIGDDLQTGAGKAKAGEWATLKERLHGSILPMGVHPAVILLGTAYEVGDLGHDVVMRARGERCRSQDQGAWLRQFRCHYEVPSWPARGWTPQWRAQQLAAAMEDETGKAFKAYAQAHEPHLLDQANAVAATHWSSETHHETYRFVVETDPVQIAWRAASVISIDHAVTTGGKSDDTAFGLATRSPDARTACLEYAHRAQMDIEKIIDHIWWIWERAPDDRKPTLLLWERVQGGTALAGRIKPLPPGMQMWCRTETDGRRTPGYVVRANKDDRISALYQDAKRGALVLLASSKTVQLFKDQAEAWRPGMSGPGVDDLLDAVSGGVRYLLTGDPEM